MLLSVILSFLAPATRAAPADGITVPESTTPLPTTTVTISPIEMPVVEARRCLSAVDFRAARKHDYYPLCNVDIPGKDIFSFLWVGQFEYCLEFCDAFNSGGEGGGELLSDMPLSPEVAQMRMRGEYVHCKAALFLPERFSGENDCYLKYALDGAIKTNGTPWVVGGIKRQYEEDGGLTFNGSTTAHATATSTGNWTSIWPTGMSTTASRTTYSASSNETIASTSHTSSGNSSSTTSSMNATTTASSSSTTDSSNATDAITVHNSWSSDGLTLPVPATSTQASNTTQETTIYSSTSSDGLLPGQPSTEHETSITGTVTIQNSWSSGGLTLPTQSSTSEHTSSKTSEIIIHNSRSNDILTLPTRVYNHDY
ncbi:uncharacterized protein AB675_8829 [Cyphellophora attinorum]|uniref:Uncharacterized protein n=1 Tax=Cyphellophora attinorum TaxID=1664694 RepID=A0A0N1P3R8_9EURO|nr:uncharacterized protein AB675_8829 [Phialophora attinorum]KPI44407.1 hypothetical protein AB675_8829 [Phialophora attinorum]